MYVVDAFVHALALGQLTPIVITIVVSNQAVELVSQHPVGVGCNKGMGHRD